MNITKLILEAISDHKHKEAPSFTAILVKGNKATTQCNNCQLHIGATA